MPTVYIAGQRRNLRPVSMIGKGGEADIYDLGNDQVLKLYKEPGDPDYQGNHVAQAAAIERLREQQRKLPALMTLRLPGNVIKPQQLGHRTSANGPVAGYTMRYLRDMEVLLRLGDRKYREQGGIDGNQVTDLFKSLHTLVTSLHKENVVIGDFNDLNVLVDDKNQVYLVDADSLQFGGFICRTFTSRFLDPQLSDGHKLVMVSPHNNDSDWYAFNVMLFQSLLYVGPYGGVHHPKLGNRLQHDDRVLKHLSVFNSDVIYPKPALPYGHLPDEILEHFRKTYEAEQRGGFPLKLLEGMRWTTCSKCGTVHARPVCPVCASPGLVVQTIVRHGSVSATEVLKTKGQVLQVAYQGGKLYYLYHDQGEFRRQDGRVVLSGDLQPGLRFRINATQTLLGKGSKLFVFSPNEETIQLQTDQVKQLSIFDSNGQNYFWLQDSQLVKNGLYGKQYVGSILPNRTLIWTGKRFGLGFYQTGNISRAFLFSSDRVGLNDNVNLPHLSGQLIDATCVFSDTLAWLMLSFQENGQFINRCFVIEASGNLLTEAEVNQKEDHWLAKGLRGHFANRSSLLVATDEGIVRVEASAYGTRVAQTFPDTEPYVDVNSSLAAGDGGIYVTDRHSIRLLKIK